MTTIVEPKEYIDKLWGKQKIKPDQTYRLMRYVLRVDCDGKMLLHNVVTGHLIVLREEEAKLIDELPQVYSKVMEPLVTEHYLVPEEYDEFQQVTSLRTVLRKLDNVYESRGIINHYTIIPTTSCNARCYYCFEQGVTPVTMSKRTADNVIEFIKTHCDGQKVLLTWFGGEPTLAVERIDQICDGLKSCGVEYYSEITTNGYLFDDQTAKRAKALWHLKSAMICVDGTEESYNLTKHFVYKNSNPYHVVMRNIGLLLAQGILVHLRMNFDVGNYAEFADLVKEVSERFQGCDLLSVTAHPIVGEYEDYTGQIRHGSSTWFKSKISELNQIANDAGLQHRDKSLPWLKHNTCMAASDSSVVITVEGNLVSCAEQFGEDQWKGNLQDGVTNTDLAESWKETIVFDKCVSCVSFPDCVIPAHCMAAENCVGQEDIVVGQKQVMKQRYEDWRRRMKGGDVYDS